MKKKFGNRQCLNSFCTGLYIQRMQHSFHVGQFYAILNTDSFQIVQFYAIFNADSFKIVQFYAIFNADSFQIVQFYAIFNADSFRIGQFYAILNADSFRIVQFQAYTILPNETRRIAPKRLKQQFPVVQKVSFCEQLPPKIHFSGVSQNTNSTELHETTYMNCISI